jgi:hypothetical protein
VLCDVCGNIPGRHIDECCVGLTHTVIRISRMSAGRNTALYRKRPGLKLCGSSQHSCTHCTATCTITLCASLPVRMRAPRWHAALLVVARIKMHSLLPFPATQGASTEVACLMFAIELPSHVNVGCKHRGSRGGRRGPGRAGCCNQRGGAQAVRGADHWAPHSHHWRQVPASGRAHGKGKAISVGVMGSEFRHDVTVTVLLCGIVREVIGRAGGGRARSVACRCHSASTAWCTDAQNALTSLSPPRKHTLKRKQL